ncbi:DUF2824 family protein [Salmonella enterica]|nr:DUF2824 family protein [Salmonella enterica]EEG1973353.1 DUF2824 family protein [Salmonella enterica]EEI2433760.1 DUF2824 family protein [Salmonella enterica]EEO7394042.1 DUF2824 family protein [Salmonella enterica]EEO7395447.1 DUF2824 family protein [Salmonella enterica]
MVEYRYDGTVKTVSNWPADSGFTQYELGSVRDITRLRGRYAWSKDGTDSWFITDLEDESHPDRYSAEYRAESQPDGIIGIGTWRDFIVCFGSSTIEYFSLTGTTTAGAALYVAQPSLMVQKGIAGTYCKTPFADSYAFISHPATGAPSVYIIGSGQASPIATASIEKIIRSYTAEELATGVMETLRFDSHELLIIHIPRHVLVYDASSSQNGPQWCVLKTGLYDDVYRAIDFMYEGNQITCGDKSEAVIGQLQFDISSQYDKQQEHLLFTPLFKADNARCFDLEVESSTGVAQYADRLFLSATTDGINYGREQMIEQNEPFVYDKRVIWKRVGRNGYDYKPECRYFEVNVHGQFGGIVYYNEIQPLTFDCHAMYLPEIRGFSKEIGLAFWRYILTNTTVQCVTSFAARKFRHGQMYCAMIGLKRVGTIKKYFKGVDDVTFYSATREELIDFLNHGR